MGQTRSTCATTGLSGQMLCWPRMGEALGIYSNACLQVAEVLRQYGFVWHSAQFKLVKKAGDLQLEFRFQSSPRNLVFNQPDAPPELGSGARADVGNTSVQPRSSGLCRTLPPPGDLSCGDSGIRKRDVDCACFGGQPGLQTVEEDEAE